MVDSEGTNGGGNRLADSVHLGLPAGGPCATLARAAAVAMGQQAGFGRAVLGPLSLAVDEALILLLPATSAGVDLTITVAPGALGLTLAARRPRAPLDPSAAARFTEVVGDLVTTAGVDQGSGVIELTVTRPQLPTPTSTPGPTP